MSARVRVVSWNVRSFRGLDRRLAPERAIDLLAALDPDVVSLQELDIGQRRSGGVDQPALVAERLRFAFVACETLPGYGHALFTRLPLVASAIVPLPGERRMEPRAAIEARVGVGASALHIVAVHLGLSAPDRTLQARAIADRIGAGEGASEAAVVAGDLNAGPGELGYGDLVPPLVDPLAGASARARATFPSPWPFRSLDHVLLSPRLRPLRAFVLARGAARFASDHRPVVVDAELD